MIKLCLLKKYCRYLEFCIITCSTSPTDSSNARIFLRQPPLIRSPLAHEQADSADHFRAHQNLRCAAVSLSATVGGRSAHYEEKIRTKINTKIRMAMTGSRFNGEFIAKAR